MRSAGVSSQQCNDEKMLGKGTREQTLLWGDGDRHHYNARRIGKLFGPFSVQASPISTDTCDYHNPSIDAEEKKMVLCSLTQNFTRTTCYFASVKITYCTTFEVIY